MQMKFKVINLSILSFLLLTSCATYQPPSDNQPSATLKLENTATLGHALNPFATQDKFKALSVDGKALAYQNQYEIKLAPGNHTVEIVCKKDGAWAAAFGTTDLNFDAKAGYTYIVHMYPKGEEVPKDKICWVAIDKVVP